MRFRIQNLGNNVDESHKGKGKIHPKKATKRGVEV